MGEVIPQFGIQPGIERMYNEDPDDFTRDFSFRAFVSRMLTRPPVVPHETAYEYLGTQHMLYDQKNLRIGDICCGQGEALMELRDRLPDAYLAGSDMLRKFRYAEAVMQVMGLDPPEFRAGSVAQLPWHVPKNFDVLFLFRMGYYLQPDDFDAVRNILKDTGIACWYTAMRDTKPREAEIAVETAYELGIPPPQRWTDKFDSKNAPEILHDHGFVIKDTKIEDAELWLETEDDIDAYILAQGTRHTFYSKPPYSTTMGRVLEFDELKVLWIDAMKYVARQYIEEKGKENPSGVYTDRVRNVIYFCEKY